MRATELINLRVPRLGTPLIVSLSFFQPGIWDTSKLIYLPSGGIAGELATSSAMTRNAFLVCPFDLPTGRDVIKVLEVNVVEKRD